MSPKPVWRDAWRAFQDPYLGPDTEKFPSPFESFVAGYLAAHAAIAPDREKLARAMCRIYCGPDDPENWHDNTAHRRDADALIASGVLGVNADTIRAEAWDEGHAAGWTDAARGKGDTPNPYRKEAGA